MLDKCMPRSFEVSQHDIPQEGDFGLEVEFFLIPLKSYFFLAKNSVYQPQELKIIHEYKKRTYVKVAVLFLLQQDYLL